ncbi:MAG: HAD hydrolase-like protein [Ignavibacteria bacterium]|nr:MAG: HAD hydrolase-like protein [Ignavibacteria bacterium]
MNTTKNILAVIWDFDGTLVDSWQKNLNVTRKIISKILGKESIKFLVLNSLQDYHEAHIKASNWREFYKESFGLTEQQTNEAGGMWTEFQIKDNTPIPLLDGIEEVIKSLNKYPQGIVSQNSRNNIIRYLKEKNLLSNFKSIIGYEEVKMERQKPNPDGLLLCIEQLIDFKPRYVFYIGDHETDTCCAFGANYIFEKNNTGIKILSIGAFYGFNVDPSDWSIAPDYQAHKVGDVVDIINEFDTFI